MCVCLCFFSYNFKQFHTCLNNMKQYNFFLCQEFLANYSHVIYQIHNKGRVLLNYISVAVTSTIPSRYCLIWTTLIFKNMYSPSVCSVQLLWLPFFSVNCFYLYCISGAIWAPFRKLSCFCPRIGRVFIVWSVL